MYGQTDGYIFNEKNVSGDRESVIIDATRANKISVVYKWTGNLAGDFEVWASNDDFGGMGIGFFETNITFDTNPAGTPGIAEQEIDSPNKYYMIKFDHTVATAGNLYMSLATRFDRSLISKPIARFADASFTNTSPRYLSYNQLTESFAGGVLATRRIGGRLFAQVEPVGTQLLTYCDKYGEAVWQKSYMDITDESVSTPHTDLDGWSLTPTTDNQQHYLRQSQTAIISTQYVFGAILKANGYNFGFMKLWYGAFPGNPYAYFNLSTGVVSSSNEVSTVGIVNLGNGWYLCYIGAISDAAAETYPTIECTASDLGLANPSFAGDGSSGILCCHAQFEAVSYPSSIIESAASEVTRNADELYWASENVPNALRGKISMDVIPDWPSNVANVHNIISWAASGASHTVRLYYYHTTDKYRAYDVTGAATLVESDAVTFSRGQKHTLTYDPVAGTLKVSGCTTGDGTNTGTPYVTTAGNVYVGANQVGTPDYNGLISEPY